MTLESKIGELIATFKSAQESYFSSIDGKLNSFKGLFENLLGQLRQYVDSSLRRQKEDTDFSLNALRESFKFSTIRLRPTLIDCRIEALSIKNGLPQREDIAVPQYAQNNTTIDYSLNAYEGVVALQMPCVRLGEPDIGIVFAVSEGYYPEVISLTFVGDLPQIPNTAPQAKPRRVTNGQSVVNVRLTMDITRSAPNTPVLSQSLTTIPAPAEIALDIGEDRKFILSVFLIQPFPIISAQRDIASASFNIREINFEQRMLLSILEEN